MYTSIEQRGHYNTVAYPHPRFKRPRISSATDADSGSSGRSGDSEVNRYIPVFTCCADAHTAAASGDDNATAQRNHPVHYQILPRISLEYNAGEAFFGTLLTNASDLKSSTPATVTVSGTSPLRLREFPDARKVSQFDKVFVRRSRAVGGGYEFTTDRAMRHTEGFPCDDDDGGSSDDTEHHHYVCIGTNLAPVDAFCYTRPADFIDVMLSKPVSAIILSHH